MVIFGQVSLYIVGQGIHSCGRRHKGGKLHGEQWIGKYNLGQEAGREKYSLALGLIFGDDGASSHFATGSRGSGHSDKMRNFLRDILVAAQQVVIVKEVAGMVDP